MNRPLTTLVGAALLVAGTGCGAPGSPPTADLASERDAEPTHASQVLCDPGLGLPVARDGCPDPDPVIGWITSYADSTITVQPFRTLGNGPAGKAHAEREGLEFPFPNDHHDVASGSPREVAVHADTVCTGVIRVPAGEPVSGQPVGDRVASCADFADAVRASSVESPVPAALWLDGGTVVQVSELYRP